MKAATAIIILILINVLLAWCVVKLAEGGDKRK